MLDIFQLWHFRLMKIVKQLNYVDVLKAWDYAQTIFRSEKLRIAYIKAEIGTRKHNF